MPGAPGAPGLVFQRNFQHSSAYAGLCAPENALADPAQRVGSLSDEKRWLRSVMDEASLWRQDVPYVDADEPLFLGTDEATASKAVTAYFDALRSPAYTPGGKRRDAYSQIVPTSLFDAFIKGGTVPGYGIEWAVGSHQPPRRIRVADVQPGSEAAKQGVQRGDTLISADDRSVDIADGEGAAMLAAALFPQAVGGKHTFKLSPQGEGKEKTVTLASGIARVAAHSAVTLLGTGSTVRAGYFALQELHAGAVEAVKDVLTKQLRPGATRHLIVDLRFNQGGDLHVAGQVAALLAPSANTVFAKLQGNQPSGATQMILREAGAERISRVSVLTSAHTCGASEALINSLLAEKSILVAQIGTATCGRPFAARARNNCGRTALVQDHVVSNVRGFSGYGEGFVPGGEGANGIPGCVVEDMLEDPLGNSLEALQAAALNYADQGRCPTRSKTASNTPSTRVIPQPPWRDPLRGGAILTTSSQP